MSFILQVSTWAGAELGFEEGQCGWDGQLVKISMVLVSKERVKI